MKSFKSTLQFIGKYVENSGSSGKYVVQKWEGELNEHDEVDVSNKHLKTDEQDQESVNGETTVERIDLKDVKESEIRR